MTLTQCDQLIGWPEEKRPLLVRYVSAGLYLRANALAEGTAERHDQ